MVICQLVGVLLLGWIPTQYDSPAVPTLPLVMNQQSPDPVRYLNDIVRWFQKTLFLKVDDCDSIWIWLIHVDWCRLLIHVNRTEHGWQVTAATPEHRSGYDPLPSSQWECCAAHLFFCTMVGLEGQSQERRGSCAFGGASAKSHTSAVGTFANVCGLETPYHSDMCLHMHIFSLSWRPFSATAFG